MEEWIKVEERLPEKGMKVLVWSCEASGGYELASIDEYGTWTGALSVTHWTLLPDPPSGPQADTLPCEACEGVVDDRLMLDIDEDKETVAELMQHYINGEALIVKGKSYFVVDMKNEIIDEKVWSVFYLKA